MAASTKCQSEQSSSRQSGGTTPQHNNSATLNANDGEKAHSAENKEANLVEWRPGDAERPKNLPLWRKATMTGLTATITFTVAFGSSVFSATIPATTKEFGASEATMLLGVSLYVLGFALGPLFWGPLSEYFGRKIPLFTAFFLFAIFQIPVAVGQTLATILVCRFLTGAFGSALLAINPAMFADYWDPVDRGVATSIFSMAVFTGPTLGPIIGSYITQSSLGWRWTAWLTLIMSVVFGIISFWFLPETYEPVLLRRRASVLREKTGNEALHAKNEERDLGFHTFLHRYLLKPLHLLFVEPVLLVLTIYISLVYGIQYLCFFAIPYAYRTQRGWPPTTAALPFLGLLIGIILASITVMIYTKTYYRTRLQARGKICPEDRLLPMIAGSIALPVGLFWFAWTSNPEHVRSWVPQVLAGIPIGFGIPSIFMPGVAYMVDFYQMHASSAISANTFVRSLFATAFPLFAPAMYNRLGVEWATSLLGFLCVALIPGPVLFYCYGATIRKHSPYSKDLE